MNLAFATGNTVSLEKLSAKDCKTCANWLSNIKRVYGDGGRIEGGQLRVKRSGATEPAANARVDIVSVVTEQVDFDAKGKTLDRFPQEEGRLVFTLRWTDGNWQVREIKFGTLE